jgi:two-component system nitrogen regulation response regulator NtrX
MQIQIIISGAEANEPVVVSTPQEANLPLREARAAFERDYLTNQLRRFSNNVSKTAEFVGMERSALHRKLKALGLDGGSN